MKRSVLGALAVAGAISIAQAAPALAQDSIVTLRVLAPDMAIKLAQAALADCRRRGYQVAVSVVDRSGLEQVTLRDRFGGAHTPETARRKAWTAVSFRTNTTQLAEMAKPGTPNFGVHHVPGALLIGGGVMIEAAGSIIGGIGVSGAPGGAEDEKCALAGLETIRDVLDF
jgi:uncharacterized protein GlcG (DUF336 family)